MCISYKSRIPYRAGPFKRTKTKEKRQIPFDEKLMRPDPDFVDERIKKEVLKHWRP